MISHFKRISLSTVASGVLAAGLAVSSSGAHAAGVTNPGFENGLTGWTATGGSWFGGWPMDPTDYTGSPTLVSVQTGGTDAITGIQTVFEGAKSVRLNDSGGGNDVSVLKQTVLAYDDGLGVTANGTATSLYFAWNAVLEPSHDETDSPNFLITVKDLTTNTTSLSIAYSAYTAQNSVVGGQPLFRDVNGFVTSDWRVENVSVIQGHDYEFIFLAADCAYGGHGGYVYLDGFGGIVPTANANVQFNALSNPNGFDPAVDITQGATLVLPLVTAIPDIDTAVSSYSTAQLNANQVNPRFTGGTLTIGTSGDVSAPFTVTANGGVVDTGANTVTLSGGLTADGPTDNGRITKTGAGVLILAGSNTHAGTTIQTGKVSVASDSSLGLGYLEIGNGVLLATNDITSTRDVALTNANATIDTGSKAVSLSGIVSGAGSLNITGAGAVTLSGVNTYSGATRVDAGSSLVISSAANLGSTSGIFLTGDPIGTVNGRVARLATTGSMTIAANLIIAGDPEIDVATGTTTTISGLIADGAIPGDIVKTGAGTLVLTADNTYTGGTIISAGDLQLGDGGTSGSVVGDITNNAALVVNRSNALTLSGVMTGTGSLTKTGTGTVTLSGANTYSGGTTVSAGRLVGSTTSLQGAIANNAAVEFAQSTAGTYAGVMTGTGSLTKTGTGTLILTADSAITGVTDINAGTLSLQGRLGTSVATVASGATLNGVGTIGGNLIVSAGGTLSPGNSPGTLTVTGTATFSVGSIFNPEIDGYAYSATGGAGTYDRLAVTGAVTIAGGAITPKLRGITGAATNGFWANYGDAFTVITGSSVAGAFDSLTQPSSGLPTNSRLDIIYQPTAVKLVLTPASYAALARSNGLVDNVVRAATGLDSVRSAAGARFPVLGGFTNDLYGMNGYQAGLALTQMAGQIHAQALQSVIDVQRSSLDAVIEASCDDTCLNQDVAAEGGYALWTRYVGQQTEQDGDYIATSYNSRNNGFVTGLTVSSDSGLRVGVAGSYVENKVSTSIGASSNSTVVGAYAYGHYVPSESFVLSGLLGVSGSKIATSRDNKTTLGTITSTSSKSGTSIYANLRSNLRLIDGKLIDFWANAAVEFSNTSIDGTNETAADSAYALAIGKTNWNSLEGRLGGKLVYATKSVQASLNANWLYQMSGQPNAKREISLGLANWTVDTYAKNRNGYSIGASLGTKLTKSLTARGVFERANYGQGVKFDRFNAGLFWAF